MIWGKKKQHKLPKFPEHVIPTFRSLCTPATTEELLKLQDALVEDHVDKRERAEQNSNINIKDATAVYECCAHLIEIYSQRNQKEQSLIIGAIRYAVHDDDALCDHTFASGLSDDIQVLNHVLEELGIHDRYLHLF